ncbi:MAG: transglutaminase domain-containing protein [Gammaproteobacteria bacterium]|nr:transglutaminase domain-containing protein [Gammaproteobacteria bacterium]
MHQAPFIIAAGLIFWSWQTGYWLVGLPTALLLEGSRFTSARWVLDKRDFNRIVDISVLLFLATTLYLVTSERSFEAFNTVLIWLPASALLLLAAQKFSTIGRIPLTSLFFSLRLLESGRKNTFSNRLIDLTLPYFGICLLAASGANQRTFWFYPALVALIAWGLWFQRSLRFHKGTWVGMVLIASLAGYGVMSGFLAGQAQIQSIVLEWFENYRDNRADPYRSRTALGYVGTLKQSDDILFRVEPEFPATSPILLRDASYNLFTKGIWFAEQAGFKRLEADADATTWQFSIQRDKARHLIISAQTNAHGDGLLAMPRGAFRLEGLPAAEVERNGLGAVKVENGPPLISYRVSFNEDYSTDAPPGDLDTYVPPSHEKLIDTLATKLDLSSASPVTAIQRVAEYFDQGFTYSLTQGERESDTSPLAHFLETEKSGHCEYYATATVLLLRQAGIPTRYATGYSAQEYSWLDDAYLVRKRHGHAWALAYVDGRWNNIDNTPSVWRALEENSSSSMQPFSDFFSFLKHRWQRWRWSENQEGDSVAYLILLLIPLILLLAWRLSKKRHQKTLVTEPVMVLASKPHPGSDSPFYAIIDRLNREGHVRAPGESASDWLKRIEPFRQVNPETRTELPFLLELHYRYRFDPIGITAQQKSQLESGARKWLEGN